MNLLAHYDEKHEKFVCITSAAHALFLTIRYHSTRFGNSTNFWTVGITTDFCHNHSGGTCRVLKKKNREKISYLLNFGAFEQSLLMKSRDFWIS